MEGFLINDKQINRGSVDPCSSTCQIEKATPAYNDQKKMRQRRLPLRKANQSAKSKEKKTLAWKGF